jgi:hypothetical protein
MKNPFNNSHNRRVEATTRRREDDIEVLLSTTPTTGELKQLCPLEPLYILVFISDFVKGIKVHLIKPQINAKITV